MLSPYTGKEMKVVYEPRTWKFRGESYDYIHTAFKCEDTGELFTTCESDDAGFLQVTNQYRAKYGIPFQDEIIATRNKYEVSATKMSYILGIGTNQWRLYENGEVPSVSNGRMIRSIMNPKVFLKLVDSIHNLLTDREYATITKKILLLLAKTNDSLIEDYECKKVFRSPRSIENGFSPLSLQRLKAIMLLILNECGEVFCTKMNKLLFFIDFLSYRQRGISMTGLAYRALEFGPVPEKWDRVYSEFEEIHQEGRLIGKNVGYVLIANTDSAQLESIISSKEKEIIHIVCNRFKDCSSQEISQISHQEPAWQKFQQTNSKIPFTEAFTLKAF